MNPMMGLQALLIAYDPCLSIVYRIAVNKPNTMEAVSNRKTTIHSQM